MILSKFGEKMTQKSGILQLMDDMGDAMKSDQPINMLGGGNPAMIPAAMDIFAETFAAAQADMGRYIGRYASPQGDAQFIDALVSYLNRHYHWGISEKNIVLTNGSQNAFFYLFNLFSGEYADGSEKKILLPLAPEYIGYSDVHTRGQHFVSQKAKIETTAFEGQTGFFKYRVDFSHLHLDDRIGAMCCSRPTNPTGNVLTDAEMHQLSALAASQAIPFIVDDAYGMPFPNIVFSDATLTWNPNQILCLSLSKVGLPGVRTGIVIADEPVIQAMSALNAIVSLSPNNFGASLATQLLQNDTMKHLSDEIIRPFYLDKVRYAIALLKKELDGYPLRIHQPEGAIFLWLWFEGLPITTAMLYQQLKSAGTLIIPGEYFFPGIADLPNYRHAHECIRMSYAQDEAVLEKGIAEIGRQVRQLYDNA
ncbi:valine--pyruvate transaminase [Ostreibacterium oceani]|uniref:Valine--pyruvate transaminase n=1 Tax=Ostreibacterium oceani TaxID=2654998 RepID=A0A6N7EVY0_9GAMM|nr:valine--pyruvate transaminase [Ostreibacterium oceani]MPV85710.1 valine--pyruvate transaminase [Ostreibacterium oceani]